jgi:putative membrane protein
MAVRLTFAVLHLLGLAIGFGSIWGRARAFSQTLDKPGLGRLFYADTWWGVAALIWIGTGLARAFGGFEKGSAYYIANGFFHAKMGLLILILLLEIWPMITLIKWRIAARKGLQIDSSASGKLSAISYLQAALIVGMVVCAAAMARGYWL